MIINCWGFQIDKKTDIIALAAFLLSLSSIIYQILGIFHSSDVKMFPPEQIVIIADNYTGSGEYIRISGRMAYINKGNLGYNEAIRKEVVTFSLEGTEYEQIWQNFISFPSNKPDTKFEDLIKIESAAHPVTINAGNSVSHETFFAARSIRCKKHIQKCEKWKNFLKWDEFIKKAKKVNILKFTFQAEIYDGDKLKSECAVEIDDNLIKRLKKEKWAAPSCYLVKENFQKY